MSKAVSRVKNIMTIYAKTQLIIIRVR